MSRVTWNFPLFDGGKVIENASVTVEDGIITAVTDVTDVTDVERTEKHGLLMPGLIDAHTHMTSQYQVREMLKSGVTATCDVCAPDSLLANAGPLTILSSVGMTMGTLNGKGYVQRAREKGAGYIKVLLFEPNLMPRPVLKDICMAAHEHDLKVAVHATSVKAEQMAVACGADILLHVPMREALPESLAQQIAERGVAVAPTLVMMEAFAHSGKNGYRPEHYQNAVNAVRTLHRCGVTLLAATDANVGDFAPAVAYGSSMHREVELLCGAGLTPVEALASATGQVATVFGLSDMGRIAEGKRANLVLVDGRPDRRMAAIRNAKKIWIDGEMV